MGDMAEGWDEIKKNSQAKRRSNAQWSAQLLTDKKVGFKTANGIHLIVEHNDFVVDFWPSTGKFIFRDIQIKGRGVFNLLKKLGVENG